MKHAAGFLFAGAMIGAAIALAYAPQRGTQTRKDIKRFARKTGERLDDLQAHLHRQVSGGVEAFMEAVEDGRDRLRQLIKTA